MTTRPARRFDQVDVFSPDLLGGNPLAVVHDADGLDDEVLRRFAAWTNLSETAFLLRPTDPRADYRVRILTPDEEFDFAGHPTLGSAQAWLAAGGTPRRDGVVVQECGIGLVEVRTDGERLSFTAPPLLREEPLGPALRERLLRGLHLDGDRLVAGAHLDNGPGWVVVRVPDAATVLALDPDPAELAGLSVGVVGNHPAGHGCAVEVRAFSVSRDGRTLVEDPVTGSLNAAVGQWLGDLPDRYVAAQGARLGRRGRVHVVREGGQVHVGGAARVVVSGQVRL
ncbi:PhzF family phenazine biosynthesis isomerase [Kineococcus aurantiacus]|uniref:PhzF family phenazine biosynthesis protein n=1 Tax=Kineococcus aurantiacus TaxID=37633 RepID=A0A7Y9DME4_9ACTN|nr:PhzF family phenazine biosynthesis protein [Kineococcus aurantiacus]